MAHSWFDVPFRPPKCRSKSVTFADSVPGIKISSTLMFNEQEPPAICGKDAPLLLYHRSASMDSATGGPSHTSLQRRHTWGGLEDSDSDDDLNFNFVGCNETHAPVTLPCPSSPRGECVCFRVCVRLVNEGCVRAVGYMRMRFCM